MLNVELAPTETAVAHLVVSANVPGELDEYCDHLEEAMLPSETLGRDPTDQELADKLGMQRAKVAQLREISVRPASLDAPIGDDDGTTRTACIRQNSANPT